MLSCRFLVAIAVVFVILGFSAEGKILDKCTVVNKLKNGGISKSLISNWVCLMIHESGLDTSLVKGPGTAASYSYGIFQISSFNNMYCIRGRKGGICNQKCEDFINHDITDDIACAQKIFKSHGFNYWKGWTKNCKNKRPEDLPNISNCPAGWRLFFI